MPLFFLFILFSISPSFSFIDANPARSSSSIPMMLVSSVCNRLCVLSLFLYLSFYLFFSPCLCVFGRFGHRAANLNEEKQRVCYMIKRFFFIRHAFFPSFFPFSLAVMLISAKTPATTATTTTTRKAKGGYMEKPSCVTLTTMTHRMRTDSLDLCHRYFPGLPS